MSDEGKGPVFRRSSQDRDRYVPKTPPKGVIERVPEFVCEDATKQYELGQIPAEELQRRRAKRSTIERIGNVEKRVDGLALSVKGVETKVDTLLTMAVRADEARERATAAEATALERQAVKDSEALAAKRKHTIALISALAAALALLLATWLVKS